MGRENETTLWALFTLEEVSLFLIHNNSNRHRNSDAHLLRALLEAEWALFSVPGEPKPKTKERH